MPNTRTARYNIDAHKIEQAPLYTNPTSLERQSAFLVLATWALCGGLGGYAVFWFGIPIWSIFPPLIIIGLVALTTESATDVGSVGLIATVVRQRLGMRSAPEWLAAYAHYWKLAVWPVWRSRCITSYNSLRRRIQSFRTFRLKQIRPSVSRWCSWVSAIRPASIATLARWTRHIGPGRDRHASVDAGTVSSEMLIPSPSHGNVTPSPTA
jgi:hypothetical protein